ACFFYEKTETDVKGSFRGNEGYDVCELAKKFGGGGHIKASGCTIQAPIAHCKLVLRLCKILHIRSQPQNFSNFAGHYELSFPENLCSVLSILLYTRFSLVLHIFLKIFLFF
ncbi:MAG: hypothetical protein IJ973_01580, partial [Christensenellaceae bacterium]|nr:hypothetical protein [Christensenellaceae bacterium]